MGDEHPLVLSSPPDGVTDDRYDAWYATHVAEMLARVPQFAGAERCHLVPHGGDPDAPPPFRFLTRYTLADGVTFEEAWAGLRAAVDGGGMTFEPWFGDVSAQGFVCTTVGRAARPGDC